MSFTSRFFFAFVCFFRVLFDGRFAAAVHECRTLLPASEQADRLSAGPLSEREQSSRISDSEPAQPGLGQRSPPKPEAAEPVAALRVETNLEEQTSVNVAANNARLRERGALTLLAMLQREGRFVDFVQQDVTDFDDEQIGAAARVVHEGCRRALREHLMFIPVRDEQEGDRIILSDGYDAQANKLVGNLSGKPPYTGTLQHRGWRVEKLKLPEEVGQHDAMIVAQAEIEL